LPHDFRFADVADLDTPDREHLYIARKDGAHAMKTRAAAPDERRRQIEHWQHPAGVMDASDIASSAVPRRKSRAAPALQQEEGHDDPQVRRQNSKAYNAQLDEYIVVRTRDKKTLRADV
jgi:hypothetical protein